MFGFKTPRVAAPSADTRRSSTHRTDTEPEPVEQDVLCDDETVKSDSKSYFFLLKYVFIYFSKL